MMIKIIKWAILLIIVQACSSKNMVYHKRIFYSQKSNGKPSPNYSCYLLQKIVHKADTIEILTDGEHMLDLYRNAYGKDLPMKQYSKFMLSLKRKDKPFEVIDSLLFIKRFVPKKIDLPIQNSGHTPKLRGQIVYYNNNGFEIKLDDYENVRLFIGQTVRQEEVFVSMDHHDNIFLYYWHTSSRSFFSQWFYNLFIKEKKQVVFYP